MKSDGPLEVESSVAPARKSMRGHCFFTSIIYDWPKKIITPLSARRSEDRNPRNRRMDNGTFGGILKL